MMFLRKLGSDFFKTRFRFQFPKTHSSISPTKSFETVPKRHCSSFNNYTSQSLWLFLTANAAVILGISSTPVLAKEAEAEDNLRKETGESDIMELYKVEDGSIVSNSHTINWRLLTDQARELSHKGKVKEAERFFVSALQEAKEGFGERDPHVASSCNNLAELYRVNKAFDKAEPLYLEAINILEEEYGPDDIRVGAALHNLGQFYLVQRKLEEARKCYERALKLKGRILGLNHGDYTDTMYHLGVVLHLLGKEKDGEALILDSIKILEEGGQAESYTCLRRMRYLAQIYLKTSRHGDAENLLRKILIIMELRKGWNSMDVVIAAEGLALTLQSAGNFEEAQELLERCLNSRKVLLPNDHVQIGANMLFLARLAKLKANDLKLLDASKAIAELDKAKSLLNDSIRITEKFLDKLMKQKGKMPSHGVSEGDKNGCYTLVILLQSFNALALLEITKKELQEPKNDHSPVVEAENALFRCISAYKKFEAESSMFATREVKTEYLSCLKHLVSLISDNRAERTRKSKALDLQDIKEEIDRLEIEVSQRKPN